MRSLASLAMVCMLVACGSSGGDGTGDEPNAALETALPITFRDTTFAGKTSNQNLFGAVVTHASGVEAYFCDGTRDFWFRGLASDSTIEMTDASGAKLSLDIARDITAGQLNVGGVITSFELPSAPSDSLYRADTQMGAQRVLAGWIKLPTGEQRGLIRNGLVSVPSNLDLLDAALLPRAVCENCAAFASALVIAPFTPEAAQRKPNVAQEFTVVGLGDSFMSGEGAPVAYGNFVESFPAGYTGTAEIWSSGLPSSRGQRDFNLTSAQRTRLATEAQACHRGAAGLGLAVDALRQTWPSSIDLIHQTFACSGAKVKHLIDTTYSGPAGCGNYPAEIAVLERLIPNPIAAGLNPGAVARLALLNTTYAYCKAVSDDTDTSSIRAQVPEAVEFLRDQRLKADAVIMSVGGNDMGFGTVIGDCLSPISNCALNTSTANAALNAGIEALPPEYTRLATTLQRSGINASNTFLTSHPSPLNKNANRLCFGDDFAPDGLLMNFTEANAGFGARFMRALNQQMADAVDANKWQPINRHINSAISNGICSDQPWYNTRNAALSQQGEDIISDGPLGPAFNFLSVAPLPGGLKIELSAGMFHPNQLGQRLGYMPEYQNSLNQALVTRFTPKTPGRLRPVAFTKDSAGRTSVEVVWDDVNEFESSSTISNAVGGTSETVARDVTRKIISIGSGNSASLSIKACLGRPGGAPDLCSASSAELLVEVKLPTHTPTILTNTPSVATLGGVTVFANHNLAWNDAAATRMWSTLEIDTAGTISRQAVLTAQASIPFATGLKRFRLAACNTLGCGPATAWTDFKDPPPQSQVPPPPCQPGFLRVGGSCQRDNTVRP